MDCVLCAEKTTLHQKNPDARLAQKEEIGKEKRIKSISKNRNLRPLRKEQGRAEKNIVL